MTVAYWLAHTYHVSPDVFLDKTPAENSMHVEETSRMLKLVNRS